MNTQLRRETDDIAMLLGEIKAKTEMIHSNQNRLEGKIDTFGCRLSSLEIKASTYGGLAGAVLGVGVSLLAEKLRLMTGQ